MVHEYLSIILSLLNRTPIHNCDHEQEAVHEHEQLSLIVNMNSYSLSLTRIFIMFIIMNMFMTMDFFKDRYP